MHPLTVLESTSIKSSYDTISSFQSLQRIISLGFSQASSSYQQLLLFLGWGLPNSIFYLHIHTALLPSLGALCFYMDPCSPPQVRYQEPYLKYVCKDPYSKYGHILTSTGHNFRRLQFNPLSLWIQSVSSLRIFQDYAGERRTSYQYSESSGSLHGFLWSLWTFQDVNPRGLGNATSRLTTNRIKAQKIR